MADWLSYREAAASSHNGFVPEGWDKAEWIDACAMSNIIGDMIPELGPQKPKSVHDLRDGKAYVYFIGGDATPIKIGFSGAPYERLASLQTAHWAQLRILAKVEGNFELEDAYHTQFAHVRLSGEWFERCPEIEAEITRLNKGEE